MTTVVNIRFAQYDVYIGRAGHGHDGTFGNPHALGWCRLCNKGHDRESCLAAFTQYFEQKLLQDAEFRRRVLDLRGKRLGCFCKPKHCHGDVIARWVDENKK